jgi:hypothetical protein
MADNSDTPAPVRAAAPRKTMAPAARRPAGDDERTPDEREQDSRLVGMSNDELDKLADAVRVEQRRRARHPEPPSFGLSEGERAELEQHGKTTSAFTGREITGDGAPRGN